MFEIKEDKIIQKYNIIYADPPWDYGNTKNLNGQFWGMADKHYPVMKLADIKNLPIHNLAADDCYLFLWTTSPFLEKSFEVVKSWGFKYATVGFVWIKMKNDMSEVRGDGLGRYTISNAEYCLIARKGKYTREARNVKQIIMTPKFKHSEKPSEIRDRITQLCGDLPRIELFARQNVDGWDAWGNENDLNYENIFPIEQKFQVKKGEITITSKAHTIQGVGSDREDNDFYPTPDNAVYELLKREEFVGSIYENACGDGAISKILEKELHNNKVISSDLIDRGYGDSEVNFITYDYGDWKVNNIITNPPFSLGTQFVQKSLAMTNNKVAMLLKIQFLESGKRYDLFKNSPLKKVYVFSDRLEINKNGIKGGKGKTMFCFAWFVWDHAYKGEPMIDWISKGE